MGYRSRDTLVAMSSGTHARPASGGRGPRRWTWWRVVTPLAVLVSGGLFAISALNSGGTDLRPPFEPEILCKLRPDVVVYFTDGCGPAPERPPRMPVIWCLTPIGDPPARWGHVVRMPRKEDPQ